MKRKLFTLVGAGMLVLPRIAPGQNAAADWKKLGDGHCAELNQIVIAQVANGQAKEAEAVLSKALANSSSQGEACAGVILNDLAALILNSGRPADAETFAERALAALAKSYPPNDPMLLYSLQILCSARFQEGKIGAARQAFDRMRSIPVTRPEDQTLVRGMHATLLMAEGKDRDAEAEYMATAADFKQAGLMQTADAATNLANLASLYIRQQRYDEAQRALVQSWDVYAVAKDTVPADLINFLGIRAILHIRLAEWRDAESDLVHAISLADHERQMDPGVIKLAFGKLRSRPPQGTSTARLTKSGSSGRASPSEAGHRYRCKRTSASVQGRPLAR